MPDPHPQPSEEPTPWVRDGVWTVVDQALFAGANFAVNVMLARWLDPAGYGAYTVAYTVFLLLGTVHGGYLIEPMLVFGSGRFDSRLERYLRLVLGGHARFAIAFMIVLIACAGAAYLAGSPVLALALAAFSIAQAAILFQWTMRSACFIRTRPVTAAISDGIYAALMLAGVATLQMTSRLDVSTAIALVAVASLVAGTVTAIQLGIPLSRQSDDDLERDAQEQHRAYGSWAASTGALEWFNGYLPVLLLPLWAGLAATGGLRALLNLVLPVLHVTVALTKLLLPVFVRARDTVARHRLALRVGGWIVLGAMAWAVVIWTSGAEILTRVYDGKYDDYAGHLWLVGLLPLAAVVANVAMALLRAEERPEAVFAARAAASGTAATLGAALTFFLGVAGALLSDLVTVVVEAAVMVGLVRRGPKTPMTSGGLRRGEEDSLRGDGSAARPLVLMTPSACGPGQGSGPGRNWQAVRSMADHYGVTAVEVAQAGVGRAPETHARLAALLEANDGPIRFPSIGRFLHVDGFELSLGAFARALEHHDGSLDGPECRIVGGGPERDRLAALADELGVAVRVTTWGEQSRDERFRLVDDSHVLVHPSFHDSAGYVTMGTGRPVVCPVMGGPARQITPEMGIAVAVRSPEQVQAALASPLRRLAADASLRQSLGATGRFVDACVAFPTMLDALPGYFRWLWGAAAQSEPPASPLTQPEALWT